VAGASRANPTNDLPDATNLNPPRPAPHIQVGGSVRIDGYSDRGQVRTYRKRGGSTEPLPLSDAQWLEAFACFAPLWDLAEQLDHESGPTRSPGRQREYLTFDMLLFQLARWNTGSFRAAHRFFADTDMWDRLRTKVEHAWPDRPDRRLSPNSPTRHKFHRFCKQRFPDTESLERYRNLVQNIVCNAARFIGIADPNVGSMTHPDPVNTIVGDATWIPALYNSGPDTVIDTTTGEIITRRHDPDAIPFHTDDRTRGRHLVSITTRTPHPRERIILDLDFLPVKGGSDATMAVNMLFELRDRLPAINAFAYDMALHAADIDRCLANKIIPISKTQRTSRGDPARFNLGEHPFTLTDGTVEHIVIEALDGTPTVPIPLDGEQHLLPLERLQTKPRPNADGTVTMYVSWSIPDRPEVVRRLRGATTRIRLNSTTDEIDRKKPRTRALRPIPESDPDFTRLYPRREDIESMHNHMKQRLWGGRASCVGIHRQRLDLHAYQLRTSIEALISHHIRTGADLQHWFGAWRPPPSRQRHAA
jgi:hypothetical protein